MNQPATLSRPNEHKKLSKYRADTSALVTTLPNSDVSDVEAQATQTITPMVEVQTEIPIRASIDSRTGQIADARRSIGLSLVNSLVFTLFVTQVGWLGLTTSAWFLIGSMIGHLIGLVTILQMGRNLT